jgi:hypothetical protein
VTDGPPDEPAPFLFKVLVAAAGIYLAIRAVQVVVWLIGRLR